MGKFRAPRCEVVTVYVWRGEDADGAACWARTVRDGVAAFRVGGARQGGDGAVNGDGKAEVYFFEDALEGFVEGAVFEGLAEEARDAVWTLRGDGMDRVCVGQCEEDAPPDGARTMRVMRVARRDQGSRWVRHVKAVCA